ncbi:hypothetical protein OG728_38505 (plasmid) [Streptomyces microflavus]|uniref:hypothetical protein n=1 Tax=Streptomyces microflavus TaxID=1919 RepID=UPI002E0FCDF1|nr:hypothetical protein OG728_38505 [Streptomyces microflavus]
METAISTTRKSLAVAAAVLAGAVACGTAESLTAAQKLDRAIDTLGRQTSLSFELALDTDPATLKALNSKAEPGQEMPEQVAEFLAATRFSVSVQSKKPLRDSSEADITGMAMKVSGSDGDLLEYRQIGDWSYLRAGVKALERASGSQLPAPADLPPNATDLRQILSGGWVKMPADSVTKSPSRKETSPAENPGARARQKKVIQGLHQLLDREVQLKDTGAKHGADHITATAPFQTLITGLVEELRPLAEDLPQGANLPTSKDLEEAPDKKITADFAIKNGALNKVSIDLAPLAGTKDDNFALVLRFGTGGKAAAPGAATQIDPEALAQQLLGGPVIPGSSAPRLQR